MSDPKKREVYDRYGLKGLQEGADGMDFDSHDLFSQLFGGLGGGFPFSRRTRPRRGEDTNHRMKYVPKP